MVEIFKFIDLFICFILGKHNNNNITSANNNGAINPIPLSKPKQERRRTVSFRKGVDQREELLRRSTTPDVKEVKKNRLILYRNHHNS